MESTLHKLTLSGLIVLALGIFTSVSFSAVGHVLLLIPGIYFSIKWLKEKDFELTGSFYALIAVVITCWLSVLFNLDILNSPFKNLFKTKYFIIGLISVFSFYYLKRDFLDTKKERWVLGLFLLATTVATVSGLIALKTGFNPLKFKNACHPTRACGLYGMYMTYGYGISLFSILSIGMIFNKKTFQKYFPQWIYIIVFLINFLGLILSFARGAWLGFIFAFPFLYFRRSKKFFFITALIGIVALFAAFFGSDKIRNTFTKRSGSNNQRIAFYQTALIAAKEKPVFGWGYRNFEVNSKKIKEKYNIEYKFLGGHAHNNTLEHLASTGVLGGLAFVIFCLFWIINSYYSSAIAFSFSISFFISGMVQYTFGDGENLFLIMVLFSISQAYQSLDKLKKVIQ